MENIYKEKKSLFRDLKRKLKRFLAEYKRKNQLRKRERFLNSALFKE